MADDLDAVLDRLEALDEEGDVDALRDELARAVAAFPDAPELWEWEATVAIDDGRVTEALEVLGDLLAADPDNDWARRERAAVLIDLGRFADALADLRAIPRPVRRRLEPETRASIHHDTALCLDRLGRTADADAEFRLAARLDPEAFPEPLRLPRARFEALVAEALDRIPARFRRYLDQVVVVVEAWPGPDDPDPFLLGLYVGVSRAERTLTTEDHLDHVVVYQRPHELRCADEAALRAEVRRTVVHELAHHFGIEHAAMDEEYQ
jgi:predicted Zn-dependent protease with MMP-like domain